QCADAGVRERRDAGQPPPRRERREGEGRNDEPSGCDDGCDECAADAAAVSGPVVHGRVSPRRRTSRSVTMRSAIIGTVGTSAIETPRSVARLSTAALLDRPLRRASTPAALTWRPTRPTSLPT